MDFSITVKEGYLLVEVTGRETPDQTKHYLGALATEAVRTGSLRALISLRASRPIFRVEQYEFAKFLALAATYAGARIALTGDTKEMRASEKYVELLAQQAGVNVRAFDEESAAIEWLLEKEAVPE